ncbi:MAG: ferrous iron transporter B [Bryobacterales bacterium]|nr:ferrous iron transporter B [Bryobacterales bacterium]
MRFQEPPELPSHTPLPTGLAGAAGFPEVTVTQAPAEAILSRADALRRDFQTNFRDQMVESIYSQAMALAARSVRRDGNNRWDLDQRIDRIVTSPVWGLPIMAGMLAVVFWITIVGANVFSELLFDGLFLVESWGVSLFEWLGAPWWLTGFLWNGVYRGLAWVVSVMLPPMAIFFPMFTILEDLGYLPRVAFNLDWIFRRAGAHGKQSLTMAMGFGCNAAGVIATRIIDSPRERMIAILTNNFVPCNGRWPTLIMLATLFVAAEFPPAVASLAAAGTLLLVVLLGVLVTLVVSAVLTRTWLKGAASAFTLELPPYRRPSILRILYTSLMDRTLFVLYRAMWTAAPAGALIWVLANVRVGDESLATMFARMLQPLGRAIGLDGAVMLAYIIAIPANEIVVPTLMMVYAKSSMMMQEGGYEAIRVLLVDQNGWTMLTAVSLMLFSLLHNPCGTTILTIWKETGSLRWTLLGALMPLAIAFGVCFALASVARLLGAAG